MDAITLLREDHTLLRKLSKALAESTEQEGVKRERILKQLETVMNALDEMMLARKNELLGEPAA